MRKSECRGIQRTREQNCELNKKGVWPISCRTIGAIRRVIASLPTLIVKSPPFKGEPLGRCSCLSNSAFESSFHPHRLPTHPA
jgi:hypothetical protein